MEARVITGLIIRGYGNVPPVVHAKTLGAGTIMEKSHLPIVYWFIAIHLVTSTRNKFSILELQKKLGHKRYEPIWSMVSKVREVIARRDQEYVPNMEEEDTFFKTVNTKSKPM